MEPDNRWKYRKIVDMHGGDRIARVLAHEGVRSLFTLCGGHISPILSGARSAGIRVVDTRHEATAVFAADATSRLTGVPGVAAVTAGPGVTNALTALRNASMAHSPLVLLGGATAGPLRGRGSLQDIDQLALIRPHVKWSARAKRVKDLEPMLRTAFAIARDGLPGAVFLECGVDLLYDEDLVREWFGKKIERKPRTLGERATQWYLRWYLDRTFQSPDEMPPAKSFDEMVASDKEASRVANRLRAAERPVLVIGSQAVHASSADAAAKALDRIGAPVWLSGMARGLLGAGHPLHMRHRRRQALREADLVLLAGVPCDFRLDYGAHIPQRAELISINRSKRELTMNRKPSIAIHADPGDLLTRVGDGLSGSTWQPWVEALRERDAGRDREIEKMSREETEGINPIRLLTEIDRSLGRDQQIILCPPPPWTVELARPGTVRNAWRRCRVRPGLLSRPPRLGGVAHLGRRLGRIRSPRNRHLRPARYSGDRGDRKRCVLDADRTGTGRDPR